MLNLDNVTLFCISSDNVDGALQALQYSMRGINYGAVKLITHKKPDNLPEGIQFSECYEITSIHEYNYYCIYNLTRHIDTDYCLLVQPDGFVINPEQWDDMLSLIHISEPTRPLYISYAVFCCVTISKMLIKISPVYIELYMCSLRYI